MAAWGADVHKRASERSVQEIAGNIGHVYCMVAIGLLDRQLVTLAREFKEGGGFGERLHKARSQARGQGKEPPGQ